MEFLAYPIHQELVQSEEKKKQLNLNTVPFLCNDWELRYNEMIWSSVEGVKGWKNYFFLLNKTLPIWLTAEFKGADGRDLLGLMCWLQIIYILEYMCPLGLSL